MTKYGILVWDGKTENSKETTYTLLRKYERDFGVVVSLYHNDDLFRKFIPSGPANVSYRTYEFTSENDANQALAAVNYFAELISTDDDTYSWVCY